MDARTKSLRSRPHRPGWSAVPMTGLSTDQRRKARRAAIPGGVK
jgi:hypothetical protein